MCSGPSSGSSLACGGEGNGARPWGPRGAADNGEGRVVVGSAESQRGAFAAARAVIRCDIAAFGRRLNKCSEVLGPRAGLCDERGGTGARAHPSPSHVEGLASVHGREYIALGCATLITGDFRGRYGNIRPEPRNNASCSPSSAPYRAGFEVVNIFGMPVGRAGRTCWGPCGTAGGLQWAPCPYRKA